ncbi:MAG: monovalent cation/H+ antiporter subunit D family protein [Candidatus Rokubacteria bacterium]|nr:monovalent cation/H+ antiporter subunit D family protein [Candidatus Rokubacteria bacterium]
MTDAPSILPGLALLPAGLATVLIVLSRHRPALRESWSIAAAAVQTVIAALMIPAVLEGRQLVWHAISLTPDVPLLLRADALGVLFAALASALWIVTTVYSIGYTRALAEHSQTRYFASFAMSLFAAVGIALAGNLLTFFLFFELLTIATYPLVIHRGTDDALRAGRVYLLYTLGGGTALLAAVVWTGALAGHLDFEPGGILAGTGAAPGALWTLFVLFVVGVGVKAAIMPLHTWLPVAMIAPTPVSALLHAVAVVKAGVFGLVRVVGFVFGPELLDELGAGVALAGVCAATIVLGSLAALPQDNLKRLLAFSTVSQLSYIPLGVALGMPAAFTGGVLHIASHALLKITLFFCAGALHATAHVDRISEMTGIGRRMPLTMGAFAVAAFMLAGLPPGPAFVSKWHLLSGAAAAGTWWAVAALLTSTLLNIAYFTPIVVRAFSKPAAEDHHHGSGEARPALVVPLLLTAVAGIVLGLAPDGLVDVLSLARLVTVSVLGGSG